MKQRSAVLLLGLLLILSLLLWYLLSNQASLVDAASLSISILALIISLVASFKNELFPFRLVVFSDSLHLVVGGLIPNHNEVALQVLLPVAFFNQGYSEGIVETIRLVVKAENNGTVNEFLPAMEVDMPAFVQQRKGINSSNSLGAFVGFVLESKRAVQKFISFVPKVEQGIPPFKWRPDTYTFEIHVQTQNDKKPKIYFELRQKIDNNALQFLATKKTLSMFFYSEKYQ